MIDFGAIDSHNKYITFGDSSVVGYLDGFWGLTVAFRIKIKAAVASLSYITGKLDLGGLLGWAILLDSLERPTFYYRSRIGFAWRSHVCTTALIVGNWNSIVFTWRGNKWGYWYLNGNFNNLTDSGAADEDIVEPALTTDFHIGGQGGAVNKGAAMELDNLIVIPGLRLLAAPTSDFAKDYHAGYIDPWALQDRWQRSRDADPGILGPWFWWTGEYTPGYNTVKHTKGGHESGATPAGVPVAVKDHCDNPAWIFLDLGGAPSMQTGAKPIKESKVGRLPASMYAEITGRNRTYYGLKLELPDNNNLGFSKSALPTSEQEYELKLAGWSKISRRLPDKDYSLAPVETSIVVNDPGRVLSKLLTGKLDGRAEGSRANIRLVSPYVDPSDWVTVYSGQLRRWRPRGNLPEITLQLGPNDKPLRGRNRLGYFTRDLFPAIPGDTEGQPLQMIYGTFDSLVGGGPIICPKIQRDGKRHFLSVGMVTPLQAYKVGVMYDSRSEYKIVRCEERGGRWFTEINPDSDAGSDEVTADVEGPAPEVNEYFNGRASSGLVYTDFYWRYNVPITNPAEQLLHFLSNFVFDLYERGSWLLPDSTVIDVESFIDAASWFKVRGIKGRTTVYGNETGYQFINRWSQKWRMPVFWDSTGRLAVKPDKFAVVRGAQTSLIDREHGITDLLTILDDSALKDEVLIRHGYDWVNNEFDDETRAKDLTLDYGDVLDLDQDWSTV